VEVMSHYFPFILLSFCVHPYGCLVLKLSIFSAFSSVGLYWVIIPNFD